jgi:hypothetical protein
MALINSLRDVEGFIIVRKPDDGYVHFVSDDFK